jgi:hypothetical protein
VKSLYLLNLLDQDITTIKEDPRLLDSGEKAGIEENAKT